MKQISIITTKIGADEFIETLRTELNKIDWLVGYTYPAVQKGKRQKDAGGNYTFYPQVWIGNSDSNESLDLQPDNSVKAYCFFEKVRNRYDVEGAYKDNSPALKIVVWFNLSAIENSSGQYNGLDYDFTENLVNDIVDILADFECSNIVVNYSNPFAAYNIDESNNQFLMYPFGAFWITFDKTNREVC